MVIKSKGLGIKAVKNLIAYVLRESAQLEDEHGKTLLITQHLRGKNEEEWVKEYIANESSRKFKNKRARGLYHCIISMHPGDSQKISLSMLQEIAKEFIRLRCPNSLVLCAAHFDDHIHLHLVISGVSYATKQSIRIERNEFKAILESMSEFQERLFPELEFSKVDFGAGIGKKDNEYQMRLKGKVPEKHLVKAYAEAALESSTTFSDFCESLRQQGYEPYSRNGVIVGVKGTKKYRFKSLGISLDRFLTVDKSHSRGD